VLLKKTVYRGKGGGPNRHPEGGGPAQRATVAGGAVDGGHGHAGRNRGEKYLVKDQVHIIPTLSRIVQPRGPTEKNQKKKGENVRSCPTEGNGP